jgi:transposase
MNAMAPNGKVKQHIPKELRYSMRNFMNDFPNDSACLEYIKEQRFPGGITQCDTCGVERKHHRVGNRTAYACDHCGRHIYPLAGTIFHKSATPLRLWFYAMYLMGSTRCGISAKQIQRETGVTYKTAWRMFKQIRSLLSEQDLKLMGPTVEIDETYVGGKRKHGQKGRPPRGDKTKTPVIGIVERNGKVVAKVIPAVTGADITGLVKQHVAPGSTVYSDEYQSYALIGRLYDDDGNFLDYKHDTVKHGQDEYVRGDVHTNSVEGFWSLIKNGIRGVYHQVSPEYLQHYLDEYAFRYNHRFEGNQQFKRILERVSERAVQQRPW